MSPGTKGFVNRSKEFNVAQYYMRDAPIFMNNLQHRNSYQFAFSLKVLEQIHSIHTWLSTPI